MKSSEMSKNDKNSDDFALFLLISEHAIFLAEKNQQKYVNLLNAGRTKVLLSLQTNFENIDGFE